MVIPASHGVKVDSGEKKTSCESFPCVTLKLLLLIFAPQCDFVCHSGHAWTADNERFVSKIHNKWFCLTDNVTVPVHLGLETGEA